MLDGIGRGQSPAAAMAARATRMFDVDTDIGPLVETSRNSVGGALDTTRTNAMPRERNFVDVVLLQHDGRHITG
jgi:hypothetical protein